MALTKIPAAEAGMPDFPFAPPLAEPDVFGLTSHARAKEALALGLKMREPGFNVFVVGDDRSGRMTATLKFLQDEMRQRSAPNDWLYLNNFRRPHRPRPMALPAGMGRQFRDRVAKLIPQIREGLQHAFGEESAQADLRKTQEALAAEISKRLEALRGEAREQGLDVAQTQQGMQIVRAGGEEAPEWLSLPEEDRRKIEAAGREIGLKLGAFNEWAAGEQKKIAEQAQGMSKTIAESAIALLVDSVKLEFTEHTGIARWLDALKEDAVENLQQFSAEAAKQPGFQPPEIRYAVNLLVDHADDEHPNVVLEA